VRPKKTFREADAKVAMSEYEHAQNAFHANRERLKAERLAREAAAIEAGPSKTRNPVHLLEALNAAQCLALANEYKSLTTKPDLASNLVANPKHCRDQRRLATA
jgi:hypothetical protein